VHHFRFIVDGENKFSKNYLTSKDSNGEIKNIIETSISCQPKKVKEAEIRMNETNLINKINDEIEQRKNKSKGLIF